MGTWWKSKTSGFLVLPSITLARLYVFVQTLHAGKEYGKNLGSFSECGTHCKNIHQEFMKRTYTTSGICEIFQVKKLKVTLFSTNYMKSYFSFHLYKIHLNIQVCPSDTLQGINVTSYPFDFEGRQKGIFLKWWTKAVVIFEVNSMLTFWHCNRLYGALYRLFWMKNSLLTSIPKLICLFW